MLYEKFKISEALLMGLISQAYEAWEDWFSQSQSASQELSWEVVEWGFDNSTFVAEEEEWLPLPLRSAVAAAATADDECDRAHRRAKWLEYRLAELRADILGRSTEPEMVPSTRSAYARYKRNEELIRMGFHPSLSEKGFYEYCSWKPSRRRRA